jgi:ABC-type phosphate transport system auxiliary subunit
MENLIWGTVWVVIPLAAIGAGVMKKWLSLKERQLEMQTSLTAEKAAQYAAHTERLEERVRVLERIATDRGVDLANEIDSLRDRPLN